MHHERRTTQTGCGAGDAWETVELTETVGRLTLRLEARRVGGDWVVFLYGGDRPHVGAVALAGGAGGASQLCLPNHREGPLALRAAEAVAARTGGSVCAVCGIHLDSITKDEIADVYSLAEKLISSLFGGIL